MRERLGPAEAVSHLGVLLRFHRGLVEDRVRVDAFSRALQAVVRPGASVLDIGSGSGIWAALAARLGARRVVAVEQEELLAALSRRTAAENGVAGRVEVVLGHSREITFEERFDVVVSETIGNHAFDEDIVPTLADARARHLAAGGVLVPRAVGLVAAPVGLPGPPPAPVATGVLDELARHFPQPWPARRTRPLARPALLARSDFTAAELPGRGALHARFEVSRQEEVSGLLTWAEAELAPGIRLSTRKTSSWRPYLYPLEAGEAGPATLEFTLQPPPAAWWEVVRRGREGPVRQVYGGRLAYLALRAGP